MYLGVRQLGTLFLRSSYNFLFKNISHHGSFKGFTARELCGANKWDGFDGWDLCVGLFYEHRFAMLKMTSEMHNTKVGRLLASQYEKCDREKSKQYKTTQGGKADILLSQIFGRFLPEKKHTKM